MDLSGNAFKPELINLQDEKGEIIKDNLERWEFLKKTHTVHEIFEKLLLELFLVHHPELKPKPDLVVEEFAKYKVNYVKSGHEWAAGVWAVYPNGLLIHILESDDLYILRTSRNLGLLTEDEQLRVKKLRVAVAGLSVGGVTAHCLAMEGVRHFYLTDFDYLAGSNLNRLPASLAEVGLPKTAIIARKIWDIDPFTKVICDDRGLCRENVDSFFGGDNPVDVVIDAVDSMEGKILIRQEAKKRRIPVVWMVDMGDGVVQIGVERYDQNPNYPPFHGQIERMQQQLGRELNYVESFFSILNHDHLPSRMANSFLLACENKYSGISQLAGTVSIAGGTVAKIVRMIAFGYDISNEFFISVDSVADKRFKQNREHDRQVTYELITSLGLRG
jgi:hypothetical protein